MKPTISIKIKLTKSRRAALEFLSQNHKTPEKTIEELLFRSLDQITAVIKTYKCKSPRES